MRNSRAALLLCSISGVLLAASACRPDEPDSGSAAAVIAGAYTLVSVDEKPVPATVSHDGVELEVRSGVFTINADGTCSSLMRFVPPSGQEATREVSATYVLDDSTLTMRWQGAGMTIGTVRGNTFTMDNEGLVFVYEK